MICIEKCYLAKGIFWPRSGTVNLTILMLALSLSFQRLALADDQTVSDCSTVKVYVRTIEASDPIKTESGNASTASIDSELTDLQSKLARLPFRSFRLISSRQEELVLKKRDTLSLPNGQTLSFRPIYTDHSRVGLWLSWRDKSGTDILNTRLHFDSDDSVLTGTDSATEGGLILAIKAEPVPNK